MIAKAVDNIHHHIEIITGMISLITMYFYMISHNPTALLNAINRQQSLPTLMQVSNILTSEAFITTLFTALVSIITAIATTVVVHFTKKILNNGK